MNVRDPFNLHRNSALNILKVTASRAAQDIKEKAVEAGASVLDDMAFNIPKNVPSFNNPQRALEDRYWGASAVNNRGRAGNSSLFQGVQGRVEGLLGTGGQLPMYKDKPYHYQPARRLRPLWRKKRSILGFLLLFFTGLWWFGAFEDGSKARESASQWRGWLRSSEPAGKKADWSKRRDRVVEAFQLSWDAYERYAWGYDEYHPIAKTGRQMAPKGLGWIIVDSLDTMILMNQTSRLAHARQWLSKTLTYDQDQDVNTFETTIRMLGGLLSAHYLSTEYPELAPVKDEEPGQSSEDLYLEKARDLADRLMAAFDSPSGVPYASVNLAQYKGIVSHADGGASSTAETTTLQLEFKYLAKLTGEKDFWDKVEKVMQVVDDNGAQDGLVPIYVYATDGKFRGDNIRLGSRGDSYYEYLIKQYLQTNKQEPVYLDMWDEALEGVRKHLITYSKPSGFTVLGERPNGLNNDLSPKMDHLVCFMPGTIALGVTGGIPEAEARRLPTWDKKKEDDMKLARELMQTCWGMYKWMATGLAAEITYFNVDNPPAPPSAPHHPPQNFDPAPDAAWRKDFEVHSNDVHNLQRPETVESLFYMWRITGEQKYRDWGWEMFKSFVNYTAVEDGGGFTSLSNANTIPPVTRDNLESFWMAETLKYFYLLFSPNDLLPLDKIVLNTEAHPLPRFDMGKLFNTGWKRKPRDASGKMIVERSAEKTPA
ncbi:mannosyl-oligosaccharide -alpha-mannosidase [Colletotrichum musicola]|uniref:alpha-1,2-Mannosidase n=1 Tax=Colletotrichum musicola TaxID=2175873 RepID=A0A8H6NRJ7_9PEZI|nr:mannosyl-oligosaccharide -alpha-mannosidase [Colletotrichum musicola]